MALARKGAALLYARGAKRVWLFGALAMGCEPYEKSDLDFAVDGLTPQQMYQASRELRQPCRREPPFITHSNPTGTQMATSLSSS